MHRTTLLALALLAPFTTLARHIPEWHFRRSMPSKRVIIDFSSLPDRYDHIITGGGSAGLVVTSILSEDSNATVVVLEAGWSSDDVATQYDNILAWFHGKIIGGLGATNGMYFTHPPQAEIDLWASLIGDEDYWN